MNDLHDRLRTLLFLVPYVFRHRGVPLAELAQRLGWSEQQLLAEIDFLLMIGRPPFLPNDMIDIYVEGGRVYVDLPLALDSPPRFSVYETLALAAAAGLFAGQTMGEAGTAVRLAMEKIAASLPDEAGELLHQLAEHYLVLPSSEPAELLAKLHRATDDHLELDLVYYAAGRDELTQRSVRPFGVALRAGAWYLVAYCTERRAIRVFRVSRIQQATLSERIFDPPEGFDVAGFLADSLTLPASGQRRVVLRFSSEVSRWVRERFAPEHLKQQPDGSLAVELYDLSDEYVLSYVASFGGAATIEVPLELSARLRAEAAQAAAACLANSEVQE